MQRTEAIEVHLPDDAEESNSIVVFKEKPEELDLPAGGINIGTGVRKQDVLVVDWDGPDDPENPRNWSASKKWAATVLVSAYAFASPAASAMIAPASQNVADEFGISKEVINQIVISIFVLAYAFGPLILAPLSELFGRYPTLQATNIWFLIFNIACGAARNQGELIAFRFLAGLGGGAPLAIGGGLIADCFELNERGLAISIFAIAPLLGPVLGPLTGAWVAEKASWRWVFWSTSILTGIIQVFGMIFIRESFAPVLLSRKAERIRKSMANEEGPKPEITTVYDTPDRHWKVLIKTALIRPFVLFFLEPIMQILGVYMAFIYGLFYIFLTTMPTIFEGVYQQDTGIAGIHYLALGVGLVGGSQLIAYYQDKIYNRLQKKNDDIGKPEFRLPMMFPGSFMLPIGLFLTGWTARANVHWIVPDIGLVFVGLGIIIPWLSINTYIIDAFSLYAASALATVMFFRSLCGFGFPLFAPAMYKALGLGKADSILGALAFFIGCPAPFVFWHFGERIRAASKHARK
ncbi:MFS polyamine transporter [Cristinia sonorae]|uniref:MFS polyamine transporter n=1 Tax=Cristinia sonorae TaxID=1940300 RepID=A0A8K0UEN9_9AGAR|nr:MFS polyamine transporter [Cristinia sonorae]